MVEGVETALFQEQGLDLVQETAMAQALLAERLRPQCEKFDHQKADGACAPGDGQQLMQSQ